MAKNKCIDCDKSGVYNLPTEIKGIYCKTHKKENMVNVITKHCIYENCTKCPRYNIPNEKPLYCKKHKTENMKDVILKRCIDCEKKALFNFMGYTKPIYCITHKKKNMLNIINKKSKKCIYENCPKNPSFNLPNETIGLWCSEHKKENMINVKNKKCIYENCPKRPSFNLPTEKIPILCGVHKKENMTLVNKKKCIYENCPKRPSFNLPNQKKPIYCSEHKKENMLDVTNKTCIHPECPKRSNYNLPNELKPCYCMEHKLVNMINIKSKKCQKLKCKNDALYGLKNKRPHFCEEHKTDEMVNLILENKCCIENCENEYDHICDEKKYCNKHVSENYNLSVKKLCKYCDIKEESKYVCNECKKLQNKKEYAIVRYLKKEIKTEFVHNSSKMLGGCSKKRPDIFYELLKHCVIVEIDENQHNAYGDSCECARINEIVNGIGGKSVIFIRYNPDVVKNKNNIINVKQEDRVNLLVKVINEELTKDYQKFEVKIIQLFYNDDYEIYKEIKEENITKLVCV